MKSAFRSISVPPGLPGQADPVHQVPSFAGGFDDRLAVENTAQGSSNNMQDVEVSLNDRLIVAPGVEQLEVLAHTPTQTLIHPYGRYASALLQIAAPYLGIRETSTDPTQWFNVGLTSAPYGWTDFAGVLLLSNGTGGMYKREPLATALELVPGAPAAIGLTTFAGRVVLGGTTVSGDFDFMAIGWSGATSDYADWDPANGAGAEVMIGSMKRADRFQAFAPLGFDLLGIINRRSIWIARRTGETFEPLDLQPRLEDTGTTHAATVITTEFGALFLSDDGVKLFDGNNAVMMSEQINSQLGLINESLPYSASFDPRRKRYYLHTPNGTWVLDLNKRRWYKWTNTFTASVWWPDQGTSGPTWDESTGTWDSDTGAWWQLEPQESNGTIYFVKDALLGVEEASTRTVFGVPLDPAWFDRQDIGERQDQMMTHLVAFLTYESATDATIEIWLPDPDGNYEIVTTATLLLTGSTSIGRRVAIPVGVPVHSGRGVGLGLRITAGFPHIRRGSVQYQPAGTQ